MYRIPSVGNPFVRLNYITSKGGLRYYGDKKFQLAVNGNSSQICAVMPQYQNWYNYCGPVPNNLPTGQSNYNNRGASSTSQNVSKCFFCDGSGREVHNDHVPQYGTNSYDVYVKCNECGTTFNRAYTNHYHTDCRKCGGKGKVYR